MIKYKWDDTLRHSAQGPDLVSVSVSSIPDCQCCEDSADGNMLKKLGFIRKFKLTTHHGINIGKKKDIDSEDIQGITREVSGKVRKQRDSCSVRNFSGGQISIPITRRDHYAILDFSHNSKKHKNISKC